MFEIWDRPLDVLAVMAAVDHPGAGATHVFVGRVRDQNQGRVVTHLDYQAYQPMAEREMERIARELEARIPGVRVASIHRVGQLAVGELAVVCAASAPHRAEALAACREYLEALKRRVPIWKREWGPGGSRRVGWEVPDVPEDSSHHAPETRAVVVHTLTISDTRTDETDVSGATLQSALSAWGHQLASHSIVPDDPVLLRARLLELLDGGDAVVSTGGTGITRRDSTFEVIEGLLDRKLDGFGEAFRRLSWDEVGPRAVLSRALAGTCRGKVVVALPGSPAAVRLGVDRIVGPLLAHAVSLTRK